MIQHQKVNPIWYAMIWIMAYIIIVNIGDAASEFIGVPNSATSFLLIIFSVVLLLHLRKNKLYEYYGIRRFDKSNFQKTLFYIPLIGLAFIQYSKGINPDLSLPDIIISCVLMICVGFIEELLFRGFLFQGILKEGKINKAIFISGVTFGIGHIVNLLRGYSLADQAIQIVAAIFIGIVLAYCVAITKNIVPGMIFHIFFNISGTVTNDNLKIETYIFIAIIAVALLYIFYFTKSFPSTVSTPHQDHIHKNTDF